jgi:ArsR family transcriptional regulator
MNDARMRSRADEGRASCPPPRKSRKQPTSGPRADAELAELAKAVGHPVRVQILRILLSREACVCGEIVDELPLAQSTVSQHLKVLKEAGLIRGEIDGPRVGYCVEPDALLRLKALVADLAGKVHEGDAR